MFHLTHFSFFIVCLSVIASCSPALSAVPPTQTTGPSLTATPLPTTLPTSTSAIPAVTSTSTPAHVPAPTMPLPWVEGEPGRVKLQSGNVEVETWWAESPVGGWFVRGMRESLFSACAYLTNLKVISADATVIWTVWDEKQACGLGSTNPRPFHWSQDGAYLYFTNEPIPDGCAEFVNGSDLYRVELATGQVTQLLPPTGLWLALSPNETQLAYAAYGDRGLVVRDLDSGSEREMKLPEGSRAGNIVWSPDETALMFTFESQGCGQPYSIARLDLQTFAQTTLIADDPRRLATVEWPDPERVLLADKDGNQWWMDAATGQLTPASGAQ